MSGIRKRSELRAAAVLAIALLVAACTANEPEPTAPPGVSGPQTVPPLGIRLAKVNAVALKGRLPRGPYMASAEQIRTTISLMYTAGFVDPAQWQAGYPGVLDAFAPQTRNRARDDLNQLTLGGSAKSLTSMLPHSARIVIRFLPNDERNPIAAIADMRFNGVASGNGFEVPVRHEGEYLMRRLDGRWLIVGYDVHGRVGT
ncbi:MAG: hypothetical protein ACRDH9_11480 [Actinomycetota bacterium]